MTHARNTARSLLAAIALLTGGSASGLAADIVWNGAEPPPGIFFHWYEPTFYVGFAPKTQDPSRVHIELSRGNQIRFTLVLGEEQIDNYLADLQLRQDTYQELIDKGVIFLTTNRNYERFVEQLEQAGVHDLLAQRESLDRGEYLAKTIDVMAQLNPGRIFHIQIPVERVVADWHAHLAAMGPVDSEAVEEQLDAANAILPGRVKLFELGPDLATDLAQAADLAGSVGPEDPSFRDHAIAFLDAATRGHYRVEADQVEAIEFTAIYPAGTVASWVDTPQGRVPEFGVTGVWPLIPREHGRGIGGMVDYLSSNPGYGFIPLIAYEHAGGAYYNAFHNAGIRSPVETSYLPDEWRNVPDDRDPSKSYTQLWLVSRGPASHGCTRLDSGQMSEMRNSLPSASEAMTGIPNFRNLPQCHEVFDIDGDGQLEVMGVAYFHAYKSKKHVPVHAYAPNEREPYYEWLYGDNIGYNADGSAVIKQVPTCRFVGERKAVEAEIFENLPLYEAPFRPEPIQFYQIKDVSFESAPGFEFNRELRRIGIGYETNRAALFLD